MNKRKNITTGAPWEDIVGYSRAIKVGNLIEISGTTAPGDDEYGQTMAIIESIKKVLKKFDSDLEDVIRTRIYCTDISNWEKIGKAHAHFFKEIKPVTSMVEVSKLITPEILVEIEFSAMIS